MKKFLAVATALMLAISSLCVFVVADEYELVTELEITSFSNGLYLSDVIGDVCAAIQGGGYMEIDAEADSSAGAWFQAGISDSSWSWTSSASTVTWLNAGTSQTITITSSDFAAVVSLDDAWTAIYVQGGDTLNVTAIRVYGVAESSGEEEGEGEDQEETTTPTDVDTSNWSIGVIGYDVNNGSTWSGVETKGLTASVTVSDLFASAQISDVSNFGGMLIQIWNLSGDAEGVEVYYTISINGEEVINTSSNITVSEYDAYQIAQLSTASFIYAGSETYTFSADDVITITVSVPTTEAEPGETGGETGGETETTTTTSTRASGLIYVNEEYHGFLIVRNGTKHLACVPHTVDANGYCTVCKEYIGVDGDVATTEINGGEYVEAYSEDILFTSSGWGTYDLGDTALIDALSVEGSILVITRDRETSITFDDNSYEKFGLVDSWWSGDWMQLGTGGHTDADEESATIIDCISDDGVSVMYDGNTIYDAWVAAGMSNGGTATLITNTSGLYQITNVTVYVPAGSTTVEEVEVTEPQEPTDTETEEDGTDDVDVSETDTDDTADVAESNPTTGVVIALVPMAIAGLAVVASKRR